MSISTVSVEAKLPRKQWYRQPSVWVGMIVSLVAIGMLASIINPAELVTDLQQANIGMIVVGLILIVVTYFLRALRWNVILGLDIPFWDVFHAENIGYLLNTILPLRMGEPGRAYVISRSERNKRGGKTNERAIPLFEALSTVVVARLSDTCSSVVLFGLVLPILDLPEPIKLAGYTLLIGTVAALIVLFIAVSNRHWAVGVLERVTTRLLPHATAAKIVSWGDHFLAGLGILRSPRQLFLLVITTLLTWIGYVGLYYFMLAAFWPQPPLSWALLALVGASIGLTLPSSPAAVGVFHAAVVFVLTPYTGADRAAAYAIVLHAAEQILTLLFGIYSLSATGLSLGKVRAAAAEVEMEAI